MKKSLVKVISIACVCGIMVGLSGCTEKKVATNTDKVTVTMWTNVGSDASDIDKARHDSDLERLRKHFPQYEIKEVLMQTGTDYRQIYDKNLMAGLAPSLFTEFSYTDIPTRIKNGTVADITEFVNEWEYKKADKVITQFDEAITKDGKWYAVPRDAYVQATMYNKKLIAEGGGDPENPPTTWDEFAKEGQKITDFSKPRIGYVLLGQDWCAWPFTAWVWSAGGEMVRANGDGKYKISFNEPAGVDAALYMNEMIWKYKMTQKNVLQSFSDTSEDIVGGRAAFSWSSIANFKEADLKNNGLSYSDFGMMTMPVKDPSIKRPALSGGEVCTFNPKITKEELKASWEIANFKYYDDTELMAQWDFMNENNVFDVKIPGRKDLLEKKLNTLKSIPDQLKKDVVLLSDAAKAEPFCPNWSDVKSALVNPLQKIFLTENITRDEVQSLLDKCANDLYAQYPDSFAK